MPDVDTNTLPWEVTNLFLRKKNVTLILPRSFPIKLEIEDITDTARLS